MRIIKPARLHEFASRHATAAASLERWLEVVRAARWRSLADVRLIFRDADVVRVGSGRPVVIFNIAGNRYRLIAAIHYNLGKVFVLRFLTHAEYSKEHWKDGL